jgi:uncharacterized membrane protein YeaQ/YmgE (transglycosylase-associated protein family)
MNILWLILIGFVAGLIARFLHPGVSNEPSGFILTTLLGIAGSFVPLIWAKLLAGIRPGKARGSLAPWWAPSLSSSCGAFSPNVMCRPELERTHWLVS